MSVVTITDDNNSINRLFDKGIGQGTYRTVSELLEGKVPKADYYFIDCKDPASAAKIITLHQQPFGIFNKTTKQCSVIGTDGVLCGEQCQCTVGGIGFCETHRSVYLVRGGFAASVNLFGQKLYLSPWGGVITDCM